MTTIQTSSGEVQEMPDEVLEVAVSELKSTPFWTMKGVAHDF